MVNWSHHCLWCEKKLCANRFKAAILFAFYCINLDLVWNIRENSFTPNAPFQWILKRFLSYNWQQCCRNAMAVATDSVCFHWELCAIVCLVWIVNSQCFHKMLIFRAECDHNTTADHIHSIAYARQTISNICAILLMLHYAKIGVLWTFHSMHHISGISMSFFYYFCEKRKFFVSSTVKLLVSACVISSPRWLRSTNRIHFEILKTKR